jgi:SAM-dependent methyltransferase
MNERIYMTDDDRLGIVGEPDEETRKRHFGRYERALELADKDDGLWLDCACGSGYGAELIAAEARYVYAIDQSTDAIDYAHRHHFRSNISYLCAELRDVVYFCATAGGFDAIASIETLEHVPLLEQRSWVRMAAGLLKPDGVFVVCCPVGDGESDNPWHAHEPTELELASMLGDWFQEYDIQTEDYESTSGPAIQAYCVARYPRQ